MKLRLISLVIAVAATFGASYAQAQSPVPTGKPSAYPAWWFERDVIERTSAISSPVWPDDYPVADDYAILVQGQLKAIGSKAYAEMLSTLPDAIWSTPEGTALASMVMGWLGDTNAGDNYAAITAGQLKTVAIKFYDVLNEAGYESGLNLPPTTWASGTYPWTATTTDDDNYAIALLGQAKNLFSFDLKKSLDGDSLPDWWENANGLAVDNDDQNNNGIQDALDDFDGDGLTNFQEYQQKTDPNDYFNGATPQLQIVGGNNQSGMPGAFATNPLVVRVTDGNGQPYASAPVMFSIVGAEARLTNTADLQAPRAASLALRTDSNGDASNAAEAVYVLLSEEEGVDYQIQAHSGPATPVTFTASSIVIPRTIEILAGDKQGVAIGAWAEHPIRIRVEDPQGDPMSEIAIEALLETNDLGGLAATSGGTAAPSLNLTTDVNGEAEFAFQAGAAPAVPARIFIQPPGRPQERVTAQLAVRPAGMPGITAGLLAWYAGQQNADDSWGLHHGTNQGAAFAPGISGMAFDLDGVDAFVETAVKNGAERTIIAWFKPRTSADVTEFVPVIESSLPSEHGIGFGLDNGKLEAVLDDEYWNTTQDITLNEWQQVALVVTTTEARLYLNGVLAGTHPYTQGAVTDAFYLLGKSAATGLLFDGLVDEALIYERALDAAEITELYDWFNALPTAETLTIEFAEDYTKVITLAGSSPRNLPLNYEVIDPPQHGAITQNGSQITYIPELNYNGADTFTYRVDDLVRQSEPALVSITIQPLNDAPWVYAGANQATPVSQSINLSGTVIDVDLPAQTLTYTWKKDSGQGEVTFGFEDSLATTATFSAAGTYTLRLSANDGQFQRSDTLLVIVNEDTAASGPQVSLSSPLVGTTILEGASVSISASVTPGSAAIASVAFYEGSRKLGETTTSPYSTEWTPIMYGKYMITAVATDVEGVSSVSVPVLLAVTTSTGAITAHAGNNGSSGNAGESGAGLSGQGGSGVSGTGDQDGDGLADEIENEIGTDIDDVDSDNDGVEDGDDTVPKNKKMRVKAAPEVNYAIISLGETDAVGTPEGVNDKGEVLLLKGLSENVTSGTLWAEGQLHSITDEGQRFFGPLQDGSVYFLEQPEPFDPENPALWVSPMTRWTLSGATPAGLGAESDQKGGPPLVYLSATDRVLGSSTKSALNSSFASAKAAFINFISSVPGEVQPEELHHALAYYTTTVSGMNDAGMKLLSGSLTSIAGAYVTPEGQGQSNPSYYNWACGASAIGWGTNLLGSEWSANYREEDANVPTMLISEDLVGGGSRLTDAHVNSDGFCIFVKDVAELGDTPDLRGFTKVGATEVPIPSCISVSDLTQKLQNAEGPYILGGDGETVKLWCYGSGEFSSIPINGYPHGNTGVVGRSISNQLVIPMSQTIWRNCRVRDIAELCGDPEQWDQISVSQVSPVHNIIIGTALKIKNPDGTPIPAQDQKIHGYIGIPIQILIPQTRMNRQTGNEEYVFNSDGSVKLANAEKLAIGTLELSFDSTAQRNLKSDWIEQDPDRFYIQVTDPGLSGQGPIKVRVWTDSEGTDYDDDARGSADSNVVDLYEKGSSGVFASKSMLLTSNDGDDDQQVDGIADDVKNDRTRKIALGGKLKVELLAYKQAPEYKEDISVEAPVEKTVQVKFWIAKTRGALVFPKADVENDYKIAKETLAQAGVELVVNPTIVEFADSDAGLDLSSFAGGGLTFNSPEANLPNESKNLFNWIDKFGQRGADEISVIYVNFLTTNPLLGANLTGGIATVEKRFPTGKFANHILMGADEHKRYILPHELLHVLLNAVHDDYSEFSNIRMTWSGGDPDTTVAEGLGVLARKRISKRIYGKQSNVIKTSKFAK